MGEVWADRAPVATTAPDEGRGHPVASAPAIAQFPVRWLLAAVLVSQFGWFGALGYVFFRFVG